MFISAYFGCNAAIGNVDRGNGIAPYGDEGRGYYISFDPMGVADGNRYVFEICFDNARSWDFRRIDVCQLYLRRMLEEICITCHTNIKQYLTMDLGILSNEIACGRVKMHNLCGVTIANSIENNPLYVTDVNKTIKKGVGIALRRIDKRLSVYYMNGLSVGCGIIKNADLCGAYLTSRIDTRNGNKFSV